MIIRWEDLEPGDVVRVSSWVKNKWPGAAWTKEDLVISSIQINYYHSYTSISVHVQDDLWFFLIDANGRHISHDEREEFFELVSLGDRC